MNSTLQPNSLPQPQVSLPSLLFFQPSPDFRPLFSIAYALFHFPYPVTPLFAALTKTAGCVPTIPKMEPPGSTGKELPLGPRRVVERPRTPVESSFAKN